MSAFEATIRLGEIGVGVPDAEEGKKYQANLIMGVLALTQVGPNQVLPIPLGTLIAPLDKATVGTLIQGLQEAHDQMDKKPDIHIASDLSGLPNGGQR